MEVGRHSTKIILETIEDRFKDVANLDGDLSLVPMPKKYHLQPSTNKQKSDVFGEVFTPIWLVDRMVERISDYDWRNSNLQTGDFCAGFGQFTIRILRKKYSLLNESFDIKKFLFNTHYFSELQISSCYKLIHIFSPKITLYIGDSKKLQLLTDKPRGIYYFTENNWIDITDFVKELFGNPKKKYSLDKENKFVSSFTERFKDAK